MIDLPLLQQTLLTRTDGGFAQVFDPVRRLWVSLTPEEHVRQLLLRYLIDEMAYPASLIAVERALPFLHTSLRFDLVVFHRTNHKPWLLAECKAPEINIDEGVLQQLLRYHSKLPGCRYWLITNGQHSFCADAAEHGNIIWMDALPAY